MIFNLLNNQKERFEKSWEFCTLAFGEILHQNLDRAFELYQQAIRICPENPMPYWPVISSLHLKKKDNEAFDLFQKVRNLDHQEFLKFAKKSTSSCFTVPSVAPNLAILLPDTIGMLIVMDEISMAKEVFITELQNLRRGESVIEKENFKDGLAGEIIILSLANSKKLLNLLLDIALGEYLSVEEWQSYNDSCVEQLALRVRVLMREENLSEALAYIEFTLPIEITSTCRVSRDELLVVQKTINEEIRELKKWTIPRSDDDFLSFLFKRLAFKFHPDHAIDEKDRAEKTKIMQEINRAKDEKSIVKLKNIVNRNMPEWSKYLRGRH